MRRINTQIILGLLLLGGGALLLLQTMGYLKSASDVFWGGAFLLAGAVFLSLLFQGHWWPVFPGMTLLGLGAIILLGDRLGDFSGMIFLGAIAIAFWLVYIMERSNWWALIPAGVLTTLAAVTVLPERVGAFGTGGVFFIGLALTFLLVAIAAGMGWAYYPAAALGVLGVLATLSLTNLANYIWAAALILGGGLLIARYFMKR